MAKRKVADIDDNLIINKKRIKFAGYEDCCKRCLKMTGTLHGLRALVGGGYMHHNWQEIQQSLDCCTLCTEIWQSLESDWAVVEDRYLPLRVYAGILDTASSPQTRNLSHPLRDSHLGSLEFTLPENMGLFNLALVVVEESPVANFISGRRGSKRLTSSIVDKTRKWLDDCQDQHQYCPKRCTPKLPKRVLAIAMDGDDSLRLHVSQKEERGEYAALSYCWGGDQQFKTTRSSISAYTKSMSLHLLPNTLRDAVKVCQKMGTRFLWIDSLCIVQDDPEDKNEEIAGMGSIYKNATYSIAAASARTVHEGFLSTAKDDSVLTKLPLYLDQCSSEPIFVRPEGGDISAHEDEPLFNRGWTLQEMILSPRMLVFDSYQLMVKCTESYFEPIVPTSIQLDDTRLGGLGLPSEIFGVASREMMEWNKYRSGSVAQYLKREQLTLWRHLIHEYSRRELTLFTDRLPALAGVAFELWKYWGGTYVAGLWKESLVEHLGWQAGNSDSYGNIHIDIHIDEHIGGLPSWSWITAPYKVLIDNGITPDAKVLDCRVEHLSQDVPFGQVRDASITLEAIILNPADVKFPADLGCRVVAALTELESCAQNVILETTRLLLLGWSLDKGVFLVIKEAENGTYTRIGLTKIKRDKISELLVLTRRMSCVLK